MITLGENSDASLTWWRMKNNGIVFNVNGIGYVVRILTGRPMHKRDLNPVVGFDRDTLPLAAPFASSYRGAELDKSYEASRCKDEDDR